MGPQLHIVRNNLMGANVARRGAALPVGDGGVNGVIMPDGSQLGFHVPVVTDVSDDVFNVIPFDPGAIAPVPADNVDIITKQPPQYLLATALPTGRTTTRVPGIKPVATTNLYGPAPGPDPILTTGPPYIPPGDIIPPTDNPLLWPTNPIASSPVGTPAPPPISPVGSGVTGTPYATPVITQLPPGPTVDPITGAVTGTPVDTSQPVGTTPGVALTPATTTATTGATASGYITIFGINIPIWLLWVLGIGGVLWFLFSGETKRRR
jgi:hypothetical protein